MKYIDQNNEILNFRQYVMQHDVVENSTFTYPVKIKETNRSTFILNDKTKYPHYHYFENIILHIEFSDNAENISNDLINKIIQQADLYVGSELVDRFYTSIILNYCQKTRCTKSFMKDENNKIHMFISLPFNLTSLNNVYMKSFNYSQEVKVILKYHEDIPTILNENISYDSYIINTSKNKLINKSTFINNIVKANDPMFKNSVRNISSAYTIHYCEHILNSSNSSNLTYNFYLPANKKIDGLYFYFDNSGNVIMDKMFNFVKFHLDSNQEKIPNISYPNVLNLDGISYESFVCGSTFTIDEFGIYHYPIENIGKLQHSENIKLIFDKFNKLDKSDKSVKETDQIKLIIFAFVENYFVYFDDHTAGLFY